MTHVLRNAIRWNGEQLNQCSNPNQARDKQRYLSNIRQLEQRLDHERSSTAIRPDSGYLGTIER